jgi:hypothetical protein
MFKLFPYVRGARRPRTALPERRVRPVLEALEGRECPSALGTQPNQQLWQLLSTAPVLPVAPSGGFSRAMESGGNPGSGNGGGGGGSGNTQTAPVLTLTLTYNGRNSITLSGSATDAYASVAGLTITFSGVFIGTAVTDSSGNFTVTTNVFTLGTISASTADSRGVSFGASVTVQANPPVVSGFTAVEGNNLSFTFSGTVTDPSAAGMTVSFGGIPSLAGQSTTVNADGSFSLAVQLQVDGSDNGTAWAQTTNWWGLQSNVATVSVNVTG